MAALAGLGCWRSSGRAGLLVVLGCFGSVSLVEPAAASESTCLSRGQLLLNMIPYLVVVLCVKKRVVCFERFLFFVAGMCRLIVRCRSCPMERGWQFGKVARVV